MSQTDPAAVVMSTVTPTSTTVDLAKGVPLETDTRGGEAHNATISSVAPDSSTANLAKKVPLEGERGSSGLPGTFPETPLREPSDFSVKPIPATDGPGNPIHLEPGEKVPDPSTLTGNTIQSTIHDDEELRKTDDQVFSVSPLPATAGVGNPISLKPGEPVPDPSTFTQNTTSSTVTTDKETFENGSSSLSGAPAQPPASTGVLDLPPISKNMIPESSLPIGKNIATMGDLPGETISSVAPTSTTAALAAKVPLEPSHRTPEVPEVVKQSQNEAGVSPEASASATAVIEKAAVEGEPRDEVPVKPPTSEGRVVNGSSEDADKGSPEGVPEVVKNSIAKAHVDPEATTNPEAVREKMETEGELLKGVKREGGVSEPAPAATAPDDRDSRDVSPMTKPATSGVPETTADKVTKAPQAPAKTGNGVEVEEGDNSKPSTDGHATGKKKRFSWLSKVKGELRERLHHHKDKK
ncbi:MAG: hypothetical protein M1840_004355 [Geoglossum simile]|nr:MAG: hypothetical protein M1840_004355 [Geoglossum simile]